MASMDLTIFLLAMFLLLVLNALGVLLAIVQMPGTWFILLCTAGIAWWGWDQGWIGWWTLGILLGLAVIGEIIEFIAGAWGARRAGASRRAAWLALLGGLVGATIGFFVIPIIGALFGAAAGAAVGSMLGDSWAGRQWEPVLAGGRGAFFGKFWGALAKVGIACFMWIFALLAMLWP